MLCSFQGWRTNLTEKWITKLYDAYGFTMDKDRPKWKFKCPNCKHESHHEVLPCGGNFVYCDNVKCNVSRFSDVGYYIKP